jgi:hypothetical protein
MWFKGRENVRNVRKNGCFWGSFFLTQMRKIVRENASSPLVEREKNPAKQPL